MMLVYIAAETVCFLTSCSLYLVAATHDDVNDNDPSVSKMCLLRFRIFTLFGWALNIKTMAPSRPPCHSSSIPTPIMKTFDVAVLGFHFVGKTTLLIEVSIPILSLDANNAC